MVMLERKLLIDCCIEHVSVYGLPSPAAHVPLGLASIVVAVFVFVVVAIDIWTCQCGYQHHFRFSPPFEMHNRPNMSATNSIRAPRHAAYLWWH